MAKNTFKPKIKSYVTVMLAFRLSPSEIVENLEKDFGIKATRQNINSYNPLKKAGKKLSEELKGLFFAMREMHDDKTSRDVDRLIARMKNSRFEDWN